MIEAAGTPRDQAEDLGALLIASCEDAVVPCRAQRTVEPLDRVERSLLRFAA